MNAKRRSRSKPDWGSGIPTSEQGHKGLEALLATPTEAARALSVGKTTIFELIKAGSLQRVKFGRATRLLIAEIRRLAQTGR